MLWHSKYWWIKIVFVLFLLHWYCNLKLVDMICNQRTSWQPYLLFANLEHARLCSLKLKSQILKPTNLQIVSSYMNFSSKDVIYFHLNMLMLLISRQKLNWLGDEKKLEFLTIVFSFVEWSYKCSYPSHQCFYLGKICLF